MAYRHPMLNAQQALPTFGLPEELSPSGISHRWDSSISGHTIFVGGSNFGSSTGRIVSQGGFNKSYSENIHNSDYF
ncbi:MAG: hypothetical protein ACPMAG_09895 [Limisphaerales bacterium]